MGFNFFYDSTIGHDGAPYVNVLKVNTLRSLRKISNMDRALIGFDLDAGVISVVFLSSLDTHFVDYRSSTGISLEYSSIVCVCDSR